MDRFVKYILPLATGFISGIALFSLFKSFTPLFLLTLALASLVFAGLLSEQLTLTKSFLLIAVTLSIWIGGIHTQNSYGTLNEEAFGMVHEKKVLVVSEAETRNTDARYTVETEDRRKWLLTTSLHPRFRYGTELSLTGEVAEPPVFEGFDYRAYLKKEGIEAVVYRPEIETLKEPEISIKGALISFRERLRANLYSSLPHPHNTIAGAMVLGDGHLIPERVGDVFSSTGIRHTVAISGLHVTIIGGMIMALLAHVLVLGRNISFYLTSAFIILFVVFVGAPPSSIRAGIMAIILLFALKTGQVYSAPRALLFAAIFMLAMNPLLLFHDIGFRLSFLSVLGILYLTPHIERHLGRERSFIKDGVLPKNRREGLVSLLSVSLSAHLATLPLVAYSFNIVSLSAPIANVVAVPMLPIIMVSSIATAFLGNISELLSQIFSVPAYVGIETVLRSAKVLDSIPISSVEVNIGILWPILAYGVLIVAVLMLEFKGREEIFKPTTPSLTQPPPFESRPF